MPRPLKFKPLLRALILLVFTPLFWTYPAFAVPFESQQSPASSLPQIRKPTPAEQAQLDDDSVMMNDPHYLPDLVKKVAILDRTFGPNHPETVSEKLLLSMFYLTNRQFAEGLATIQPILPAYEKQVGGHSPEFVQALGITAASHLMMRHFKEYLDLDARIAAIRRSPDYHGPEMDADEQRHAQIDQDMGHAMAYAALGRSTDAVPLFERALAQSETTQGYDQQDRALNLMMYAQALAGTGRLGEAVVQARRGLDMARDDRRQTVLYAQANAVYGSLLAASSKTLATNIDRQNAFETFLEIASEVSGKIPDQAAKLRSDAFEAAQIARATPAGASMLEAMARARAKPTQRSLIDERDRLRREVQSYYENLVRKHAATEGTSAEADYQKLMMQGERLKTLTSRLAQNNPTYFNTIVPHPSSLAAVQKRLKPKQAMLMTLEAANDEYVFVVTATDVSFRRIPGRAAALLQQVDVLRCQIDAKACRKGMAAPGNAYDRGAAFLIYRDLIKPSEPMLTGVETLFVVPTGIMANLPLGVLVTKDATTNGSWLADRFALISVPDVTVFAESVSLPSRTNGAPPFVGYGNPLLSGRSGSEIMAEGSLFRWSETEGKNLADGDRLKALAPLPSTGPELLQLAALLGSVNPGPTILHVGERDDETSFKADQIAARTHILSIATHGILVPVAGNEAEPGLVFTPPTKATAPNDGLLTASEVASLHFEADWVILSACNTASSDRAGDSLSSLSQAFLFAGAHALLASHWRISDAATSDLIASTIENYAGGEKGMTRARALQKAMEDLRKDPKFAHPRYWGPFVVIAANDD